MQASPTDDPANASTPPTAANANRLQEVAQFEEIRQDNRNFEYYEREFQEVLMSLENDEVLSSFHNEYASLYHSFLKSHDGESRLLKKCLELQSSIDTCTAKLLSAEELARGDKNTIETLRLEIEKTHKKTQVSKDRESMLKDKVAGFKRELRDMEEKAHLKLEPTAQKAAIQNLVRAQETIVKEREVLECQLTALKQDQSVVARRVERVREAKQNGDVELQKLRSAIEEKQKEADAHKAVRTRKEEELRLLREEITKRAIASRERQATIEKLSSVSEQHDAEIQRTLEETSRLTQLYQQLSQQLQNINRTSQACSEENDALQRRMTELTEELAEKEKEVEGINRVRKREMKVLEAVTRRNAAMSNKLSDAEANVAALRAELQLKEEELIFLTNAAEMDERTLNATTQRRNTLYADIRKAESRKQLQTTLLDEKHSTIHHLQYEMQSFEEQGKYQNELIYKMCHECVTHERDIQAAAVQCANIMGEVQLKEKQLEELSDQLKDVEKRLQQQLGLMEAMIRERKTYTKHYMQLRSNVTEMANGFKAILLQIKQMQEEVVLRERQLREEEAIIERFSQQRLKLQEQIMALHRRTEKHGLSAHQYSHELRLLADVATEGEEEILRQRQRCAAMQKERDVLGNQVVMRDEELVSLYEKLRVQERLLNRSAEIHSERLATIQQLQQQIAQFNSELERLKRFSERLPELRLLVNTASRELRREQLRVRALLQECERPINLHPSHQLSWAEPDTFALMEKVNELQRELVTRRVELEDKEKRIREKERAYLQCKAVVARQVGPEVAEQISLYQGNLAKKAGQMRAMMESLKFFREQTELYQERYTELHATLDKLASEYIETRQQNERKMARWSSRVDISSGIDDGDGLDDQSPGDVYVGYVAPPRSSTSMTHSHDDNEGLKSVEEEEAAAQQANVEQSEVEVSPPPLPPPPTPPQQLPPLRDLEDSPAADEGTKGPEDQCPES